MNPPRLMIVEDEVLVAKDLEGRLEEAGYDVIATVDSGEQAVEKAMEVRPDLVLMDVLLKGRMDGIEAAGLIRARLNIPVIFLTAHLDEEKLERAKVTEAFAYLSKPFQDREVKVAIELALYRQQMDTRLRESEARYRQIFESSQAVKLLVDPADGSVMDANEAACRFYGFSREDLTAMRVKDLQVPPGLEYELEKPANCARHTLARHRLSGGEVRDVEIYSGPLDMDGRTMVHAIIHDVTERTRAERAIIASEERFRTIADFTYDWESWIGPDGRVIWVSPSCRRITGYTPEEFCGDPDLFFKIVHPDDRPAVRGVLDKEDGGTRFQHLDFRIVRRDGEIRWISHNGQPVYGTDGSWQGRRASNRDVTGRKEAEGRLLACQQQLRSLASELALTEERERRVIALDLHDRVGHTLAMCQIKLNQLQMTAADKATADGLEKAVQLVESAISDIRSLILEISPPALYELGLEAALDELVHEIKDQHRIAVEFIDDGRPKPLGADRRMVLYRAARELLFNAVKHSRATRISVKIGGDDTTVSIEVRDNGVGFNPEKPARYDPKSKSFGLFNIRERINHLGGSVKIESTSGQGTRAVLEAPLENKPR